MFDNVGSKIKGVVMFFFVLAVIGAFIISIICFNGMKYEMHGFIALVLSGVIFGFGACVAWLMSLAAYAFGELVEDTARIRYLLDSGNVGGGSQLGNSSSSNSSSGINSRANILVTPPAGVPESVRPEVRMIQCPACKELQREDSRYCGVCGVTLKN